MTTKYTAIGCRPAHPRAVYFEKEKVGKYTLTWPLAMLLCRKCQCELLDLSVVPEIWQRRPSMKRILLVVVALVLSLTVLMVSVSPVSAESAKKASINVADIFAFTPYPSTTTYYQIDLDVAWHDLWVYTFSYTLYRSGSESGPWELVRQSPNFRIYPEPPQRNYTAAASIGGYTRSYMEPGYFYMASLNLYGEDVSDRPHTYWSSPYYFAP
jgi:hypothetical protein